MKKLLLVLSVLALSVTLTGCKDKYKALDTEVTGQIDVMLWSGSGTFYENIGNQNLEVADLLAQNDATVYAVAKEFNKTYPNVKINVLAVQGGPTDNGRIWSQELTNYEAEHGSFPGIWATTDLPGEIEKGIVADLSRFENDPMYKALNPSIMQMMNYYGFQGGLPQYILPWGIYINKELAEDKNLDVPGFDWDIEEYTDFITNSEHDVYYGSMDTPIHILETGVNTINKQLFNYDGSGDFVDLNSAEVRALIPYLHEWNDTSVWGGAPSSEFMDAHWWWGFKFFMEGKLLTLEGDPWMMGDCATPTEDWWGRCKSADWDIYPRPATDYVDNTVGIVLDPMVVYNYCLDDGDAACTEEEELRIKIAYTFASFWLADTKSWEARAAQEFTDGESTSSAMNDSFPVTTGDLFEEQMQIWYTPLKHQRFADETKMPGFHEVLRIYEAGQFWDVSDKAFPYFYNFEGTRREDLYEWKNFWNADVNGGVQRQDANYVTTILGNLSTWSENANTRFAESFSGMQEGLVTYYGYKQEDFE